jgi:hypothetical protein
VTKRSRFGGALARAAHQIGETTVKHRLTGIPPTLQVHHRVEAAPLARGRNFA